MPWSNVGGVWSGEEACVKQFDRRTLIHQWIYFKPRGVSIFIGHADPNLARLSARYRELQRFQIDATDEVQYVDALALQNILQSLSIPRCAWIGQLRPLLQSF